MESVASLRLCVHVARVLIEADAGCGTDQLLNELCHFTVAPRERRNRENYGLGPGEVTIDPAESDNEEVTVMLLERLLAPRFGLPESKIARPDYNTHDRRNIDWDRCHQTAQTLCERLTVGLDAARASDPPPTLAR